jgi:hypothetical protein
MVTICLCCGLPTEIEAEEIEYTCVDVDGRVIKEYYELVVTKCCESNRWTSMLLEDCE